MSKIKNDATLDVKDDALCMGAILHVPSMLEMDTSMDGAEDALEALIDGKVLGCPDGIRDGLEAVVAERSGELYALETWDGVRDFLWDHFYATSDALVEGFIVQFNTPIRAYHGRECDTYGSSWGLSASGYVWAGSLSEARALGREWLTKRVAGWKAEAQDNE